MVSWETIKLGVFDVLCAQLTRDLCAIAKFFLLSTNTTLVYVLLPAGLPEALHAMPAGIAFTRWSNKRQIWHGGSRAKFYVYHGRNIKIVKI